MFGSIRNILVMAGLVVSLAVPPVMAADEVNLYSARKEELIKPLLDKFTAETGIEVNLVTAKADALLQRLKSEGRNSPADLLLTTDAGRLHRAQEAGVLAPVKSARLDELVPAQYRHPEGYWYGMSVRARPIVYVKDAVDPQTLSTYEELADSQWKGHICIRSSSNIYNQSLVASMIAAKGVEATEAWAKDFVQNFARSPKGGDRDQVKAAAAGECDIAIVNTYYLGVMLNDEMQREQAEKVAVFWPNQEDRGTHVNISGIGLTAAATNKDNAVKLMEFLASGASQEWYANVNHEYPIRDGIKVSDTLKAWGSFKADDLNLQALGEYNAEAVMLMDRVGWK